MRLIINSKFISFIWWFFAPLLSALLFNYMVIYMFDTMLQQDFYVTAQADKPIKLFPKFLDLEDATRKKVSQKKKQMTELLKKIKLQAAYIENGKKFIIFKENGKTIFLDLNQSYKNAKLIDVRVNTATFLVSGKKIDITIEKANIDNRISIAQRGGSYVGIKRADFQVYTANIKRALRDIRVQTVKKDGKFDGLRLIFVRKGTLFDKMNLKKQDIIKSIDGKKLRNLADLLPYYNRLNNTTALRVGFERNEKMKEIVYEIN